MLTAQRPWLQRSVILLLGVSVLSPWVVLKTLAWTGMVVAYSQEVGFAEGWDRTFSGEYPCPLCRALAEQQAAETEEPVTAPLPEPKLFLALWGTPVWQASNPPVRWPLWAAQAPQSPSEEPRLRPPRA